MSSQLGPRDTDCDAPPYAVVRACEWVGFQAPLDVRWCRRNPFSRASGEPAGILGLHPWKWLFGPSQHPGKYCVCGQPFPWMKHYTFRFASGREAEYLLGQCRRCRTIFWEEGQKPWCPAQDRVG